MVVASLDIIGGHGVQATTLARHLEEEGHEVSFIPINPSFPRGLGWVRRCPYARTILTQALYRPSLSRLAGSDVVHVFAASYWSFLLGPVPAILAARRLGKRVVLNYHSGEADDHLARWGRLVHPFLRMADVIVVPSQYLRRIFTRPRPHRAGDPERGRYRGLPLPGARAAPPSPRVDAEPRAGLRRRQYARGVRTTPSRVPGRDAHRGRRGQPGGRAAPPGRFPRGSTARFASRDGSSRRACPRSATRPTSSSTRPSSTISRSPCSRPSPPASPSCPQAAGAIPEMLGNGETGLLVPQRDPTAMARAVGALLDDPDRAAAMARRGRQAVLAHTWPHVRERWAAAYGAPA